ncbi:MAG TPA: autotransporter-associated beta strand repeat-containing protein [Chthoniobacteraceae bacterium]|nr:autotransporter-associated beta strand repeat-containing protein [Chthoniobacteraceae bacterium]
MTPAFCRPLATSIAILLAGNASGATVTLRGSDPINTTSFDTAGVAPNGWDNDTAPTAGNSYFTAGFQLRSPMGTGAVTFAGDSLSIDAGGSFLFKGSGVYTVNNLILNGGSLIQGDVGVASPNNIGTLAGSITVNAPSTIDTTTNTNRIITINSLIHGSAGLTIRGAVGTTGAINFTNTANDFTGPLTLIGSTPLVIPAIANGGVVSALGASTGNAANLIFNGGALRINGANASSTDRLFTVTTAGGTIDSNHATAAVTIANTGAVVLEGSGARTFTLAGASTGSNTFASILGDNGGATTLTKTGAGLWILTATNTYSGPTNINGGTLAFSNLGNLGSGTALNLGGGGLRWQTGNTIDISTARTVTLTGGTGGFNTNGQNITLAGVIGGVGNLVKQGNGVLTLSGANTFTGGVSVGNSSGAIRITNSQSFGIGTKTITVTGNVGGANAPSLILAAGAEPIVLPGSFSFTTSNDGLNGNPNSPALINESGENTINGNFTLTTGGGGTRYLINGGSLTLNGIVAPISGQSRTALFSGAGNGTANGVLQNFAAANILSVTKDGTGTWVFNGANTYTGATVVNGGALITNTASTGGGAVTVSANSTFGVRVAAPGQTFTTSSLAYTAGGASGLIVDLGSFGNPTVPVVVAPAFNPDVTTVTVKGSNLTTGVAIPLVDYTTLGGAGFGNLTLTLPLRTTGVLVDNVVDGRVDLNLTAFDYPRWTGATDGNWNTTTQNWREVNSGAPTQYIQGAGGSDNVLFDDNASGTTTVNLTTTLTPASVTVNNPAKNYTFSGSGKLSGDTGVLKQGNGRLTIANTGGNDYSGVTTISAGTLQVGDGVTSGAGQLGKGAVINNANLVFDRPDDIQISNTISGSGTLNKNNTNVLTLLSGSAYTGPTVVTAGTLRLGSSTALGAADAGTTVQGGASLDVNGVLVPVGEVITVSGTGVGGNGAVVNHGAGGLTVGLKNLVLAGNTTIGGTQRWDIRDVNGGLVGAGFNLTKVGVNDIWLKDLGDTALGSLNVSSGLLGFEGTTTFGSENAPVTIAAGGILGLFNNTAPNFNPIALQGGRIIASAGAANVLAGPVTLSADSTIEATNGVTLTLSGLVAGASGFTKAGAGAVELGGFDANTYTGVTTVNGGTLRLNKPGVAAILGSVVANAGTLTVASAEQFGPAASVTINSGAAWSNTSNLPQSPANFTVNTPTLQSLNSLAVTNLFSITAGDHDINSGQSSSANALSITGGANLRLGANSGDTTISIGAGGLTLANGTLQLGQLGGAVSATVNLGGNVTSSGTSAISAPNTAGPRLLDLQAGVRTFNVVDGTTTVAPSIQNGGLTKTGAGNLVLTGTSSYVDPTMVAAGALVVNGSISGSSVSVQNAATLQGNGATGPVTVRNGGILASGIDLLPLTVDTLTFENGSRLKIEVAGAASDEVAVISGVSLTGVITLDIAITGTAVDGFAYTLLDSNLGITGYTGGARFAYAGNSLDEGERFTVGSGVFTQDFTISYTADSGTDVILVAVPEPGGPCLLAGALAMLGLRRSRRRA